MFNVIAMIGGALGAIVYVGFFAYKVDKLPLIIIVAFCLSLMAYSFFDDWRNEQGSARARGANNASE